MQLDARRVERDQTLEADVVVVGAGAAGITLARELRGTGLRILLLESGGFTFDPATHALLGGEIEGAPYFPLDSCRLRFFGGTTNHWSGACWPLEPIDLEARPDVRGSGWPLTRSQLEPYYRRAHEVCQLGPFDYRPERWRGTDGNAPFAFPGGRARSMVWQMSPPTRFGTEYREELVASSNVTVCLHANVLELESDPSGGRVLQARATSLEGPPFRVSGRAFVLAAGGIENPRLLLQSRGRDGAALGNEHDLVGRYFMEHLMVPCGVFVPSDPRLDIGFYRVRAVGGTRVRGVLGVAPETLRAEGLLNFSANPEPWRPSPEEDAPELGGALARHVQSFLERLTGLGTEGDTQASAKDPLRAVYLVSHAEQAPNPESRVVLGEDRDALGQPRPVLRWRLGALDKRSIRRATEILGEELGRAALGRVRVLLDEDDGSWSEWQAAAAWRGPSGAFHHMGTTRMHSDPRQGVVDPDCRVHGVSNLWVAGSSVFPSASYVNPTLTLVALTIRLADHLKEARP